MTLLLEENLPWRTGLEFQIKLMNYVAKNNIQENSVSAISSHRSGNTHVWLEEEVGTVQKHWLHEENQVFE